MEARRRLSLAATIYAAQMAAPVRRSFDSLGRIIPNSAAYFPQPRCGCHCITTVSLIIPLFSLCLSSAKFRFHPGYSYFRPVAANTSHLPLSCFAKRQSGQSLDWFFVLRFLRNLMVWNWPPEESPLKLSDTP